MIIYWDKDGQPIEDVLAWGRLHEDWDYRLVAHDEVGPFTVKTVWSGLDWGMGDTERPLIFSTGAWRTAVETIVLLEERFYATQEEALAGHAEMVAARQDGS